MQRYPERTRKRIGQLVETLKAKIYSDKRPLDQILVSAATERISYQEARALSYRPVKMGEQFGPLWSTFWFHGKLDVPAEWAGKRIDLIWVAHYCESTLWMDGKAIQSLNFSFGERTEATLLEAAKANEKIDFRIEMACNTTFGVWPPEKPYSSLPPYVLDKCEVAVFNPLTWKIYIDFLVLQQLEVELAKESNGSSKAFAAELLYELNRFANEYDADKVDTWAPAHKILFALLSHINGTRVHELSVVGEAHLDLAWMWPLAETSRKIIRTASNQVGLMNAYPDYKFVCSQAYFYQELKQRLPELYQRVQAKIIAGQWIPVGGSWVEADCNLPSGESLARQFIFGQRFFEGEFGFRASECWLQDAFGFNAQLPQIMILAGMKRFVSQKFLWVETRPSQRLFHWEGIDGSRVLAHFPSRSAFSNPLNVAAVIETAREYTDDDRSARSLLTFGWGDGGGGPTRQMIEIVQRLKDLEGAPRVTTRKPSEFFELIERDLEKRPPLTWAGELYFARHRGTYTTQAATKKAMRQAEVALHNAEFLSAMAYKSGLARYPQEQINKIWQTLLLNQFHDILPGTSIQVVHEESVAQLSSAIDQSVRLQLSAINSFTRTDDIGSKPQSQSNKRNIAEATLEMSALGHHPTATKTRGQDSFPINTTGFIRREVATTPQGNLVFVEVPSYGIGKVVKSESGGSSATVLEVNGRIVLENGNLLAEFNAGGDLLRLYDKTAKREALASTANRLQIHQDNTLDYNAWEIEPFHNETVEDCLPAHSYEARDNALRSECIFERKIGLHSSMKQTVRLEAQARRLEFHCEVDWHEEHKLLKVLFPVAVLASSATYEMQFGATERPTHYNTPYDHSRFEVPGHKWVDLSEHGFGVALLTDCKYGYSVFGNEMRISLLRAAKAPDPQADMGKNEFAYAIMPHRGRWQEAQVVAEAFKFNYPLVWANKGDLSTQTGSFASVDDPNLIIDTIKKAEDSHELVLRLYECHGARGLAKLSLGFPCRNAQYANLLEDPTVSATIVDGTIHIPYRPFEIITLIVS